jgi:aminoglycoside phosphotransferase (APT) family kinase protein
MGKMHAGEVDIDLSLVARLLVEQFPQWADLPLAPVNSAGPDNAIYRLGDDLAVRLPRVAGAAEQVDTPTRCATSCSAHMEFLLLTRTGPVCP